MEKDNSYTDKIKNLPIYGYLDDICEKLKNSKSRFLILNAETAAGKSTAIPLALLKNFSKSIYMLEPRRIAALNIANRVSYLLGEDCGKTCGYQVHLDSKISKETRFTVMTEALFIRKIQSNPELEGVNVVVLDEFHERSLYTDLALSFLCDAMELRDNLFVIIMSATINVNKIKFFLMERFCEFNKSKNQFEEKESEIEKDKDFVPTYFVEGRGFPVEVEYRPGENIEKLLLEIVNKKDDYSKGDILVFLPGKREILQTKNNLEKYCLKEEVLILHSSVPFEEQKKVLSKGTDSKRRIILSSSIAETSVTIPDITVVVDSGFCRYSQYNQKAGMECLVTKNESVFNAEQRKGRAGRIQKGKCYRMWAKSDKRADENQPEILRADLSGFLLECAEWGIKDFSSIKCLDKPAEQSWIAAQELLKVLNCLSEENKITDLGKAVLTCGVNIRTACIALSGIPFGKEKFSTAFASEIECSLTGTEYNRKKTEENLLFRVQNVKKKFNLSQEFNTKSTDFSTTYALLCGFPDRLGKMVKKTAGQENDENLYQFYSGKILKMGTGKFSNAEYIVALSIDAGTDVGRIFEFKEIEATLAEEYMKTRAVKKIHTCFEKNLKEIRKYEILAFGKIALATKKLDVEEKDYFDAWSNRVKEEGLNCLPMSEKTKTFLKRVKFYVQEKKEKVLDEKINRAKENISEWLLPFCSNQKDFKNQINEKNIYDAMYWYFDGSEIDKNVPETIILPNKNKMKIQYESQNEKIIPFAEIIIQRIFGTFKSPQILGHPVLLKLLSPAKRPLQITSDLENFWKNTWPEICNEMKGRYPKHNWNYKIAEEDFSRE